MNSNYLSLDNSGVIWDSIDMLLMAKLAKRLSKGGFNNLEDLSGYSMLIFAPNKFFCSCNSNVKFFDISKKQTVIVFQKDDVLEFISDNGNKLYVGIMFDGKIASDVTMEGFTKKIDDNAKFYEDQALVNPAYGAALKWVSGSETGISSLAMCALIYPELKHPKLEDLKNWDYGNPSDPSDFNRCLGFLNAVPDARNHFNLVAKQSKEWAGLIKEWDIIESSFIEEMKNNESRKMPKTYALMKEIIDGVKKKAKPSI